MKKQGYNDRLDEKLGMKDGKEAGKDQSFADRRDESRGMGVEHPAYRGHHNNYPMHQGQK